ncbi:MAG: hypothetical protein HQK70_01420 [Desulfamplus sp.]|nr:hypothetical protein [Desulfamplus sp.]
MQSSFIKGLFNEEKESLSTQLVLWHHLTLRNILQRKFTGWIASSDHLGDFLQERSQSAAKRDAMALKEWKLNEIMRFFKMPFPNKLDIQSLNSIGIEIEVQSTALLRKIDKEFKGNSSDEMVIHLLVKIIKNFSEELKKKDSEYQNEIIQKITSILQSMPLDHQETLKGILSIEEFSHDVIRNAIFDHTLATALASFMMMVRYTIYYEISKIVMVLSGAVTLYVARPYIKPLIPLVVFLFSPIAMAAIGVGLTWWTDVYTNREIQSFLLPIMVMSSIIASEVHSKDSQIETLSTNSVLQDGSENRYIEQFINFYNLKY